ncbi:MAG: hypothetical protein R2932_30850 [Caldilineaceae bacterium]
MPPCYAGDRYLGHHSPPYTHQDDVIIRRSINDKLYPLRRYLPVLVLLLMPLIAEVLFEPRRMSKHWRLARGGAVSRVWCLAARILGGGRHRLGADCAPRRVMASSKKGCMIGLLSNANLFNSGSLLSPLGHQLGLERVDDYYHIVWSMTIPILLTEPLSPPAAEPWLNVCLIVVGGSICWRRRRSARPSALRSRPTTEHHHQ